MLSKDMTNWSKSYSYASDLLSSNISHIPQQSDLLSSNFSHIP